MIQNTQTTNVAIPSQNDEDVIGNLQAQYAEVQQKKAQEAATASQSSGQGAMQTASLAAKCTAENSAKLMSKATQLAEKGTAVAGAASKTLTGVASALPVIGVISSLATAGLAIHSAVKNHESKEASSGTNFFDTLSVAETSLTEFTNSKQYIQQTRSQRQEAEAE